MQFRSGRRLLCALAATALVGAPVACSSSDGTSAQTPAQLAGRWPASVDKLATYEPSKEAAADFRGWVPGARTVLFARLKTTGAALAHALGSTSRLGPDVVLVTGATTDSATLRHQVIEGVLDSFGVAAYGSARYDRMLFLEPFDGPGGMRGGYLPPVTQVRLAGFVAPARTGVSFAFTAHGVGVVVLGASLTRDQADQIASTLEG